MKKCLFASLFVLALVFLFSSCFTTGTTRDHFVSRPRVSPKEPDLILETGGHKSKVMDVLFTSDGKQLVSVSTDKTIRVWSTRDGGLIRVVRGQIGTGNVGKIYAAALSPDDRLLAVGGFMALGYGIDNDKVGCIRIFEFHTGEIERLLKGHGNIVNDLAFSPDGTRLVSGSDDNTARIWSIDSGECLNVLRGHRDTIYAVAFSPDGQRVVTGSWDHTLRLWDSDDGSPIETLSGHQERVAAAAFTPDGKYIVSGGCDKTARLWDGRTGRFVKVLARQKSWIVKLCLSPDGKFLLTGHAGVTGQFVNNVYAVPSGAHVTSFRGHSNIVEAVAVSPDGKTAATSGGGACEIFLWDIMDGHVRKNMAGTGRQVWSVGFSKDGRAIAWGERETSLNPSRRGPLDFAFRFKSRGSEPRAYEVTSASGQESRYLRALSSVQDVSVQTKKGDPGVLQILRNGRVAHEISRDSSTGYDHRSFTLTPDGTKVISGGMNGRLASYDTETGEVLRDFIGHKADLWAVAVSRNSEFLVSGSADQTVKLWDIASGRLLLSLFRGTDQEWVAWTPTGYYVSSPRGDKYIGWHINRGEDKAADYYSALQFERILYRPDYVRAYVKFKGLQSKISSQAGGGFFDINNLERIAPPEIKILSPPYGEVFSAPEAKVVFSAEGRSADMMDYTVFVNNIPVTRPSERELKGAEKKAFEKERTVPLFAERNVVRIESFNGKSMGIAETVVLAEDVECAGKKGNLYLLSIGVNEFTHIPHYNLSFAAQDAEKLADFFLQQEGRFFRETLVKVVSDHSKVTPSKKHILEALDFIKDAKAEDTVIVFLASHGLSDPAGNYYFVPRDARFEDLELLRNAGRGIEAVKPERCRSLISWKAFFSALRTVPGKRLLIVDTCQAKRAEGTLDIHSLAKRSAASAFALLAASRGDEASQEYPQEGQGLFTSGLLDGLRGSGDGNRDGLVDLEELYDHAAAFVKTNRDKRLGEQTPQITAPEVLRSMILNSTL